MVRSLIFFPRIGSRLRELIGRRRGFGGCKMLGQLAVGAGVHRPKERTTIAPQYGEGQWVRDHRGQKQDRQYLPGQDARV
jgi:hypothetical protein